MLLNTCSTTIKQGPSGRDAEQNLSHTGKKGVTGMQDHQRQVDPFAVCELKH